MIPEKLTDTLSLGGEGVSQTVTFSGKFDPNTGEITDLSIAPTLTSVTRYDLCFLCCSSACKQSPSLTVL